MERLKSAFSGPGIEGEPDSRAGREPGLRQKSQVQAWVGPIGGFVALFAAGLDFELP